MLPTFRQTFSFKLDHNWTIERKVFEIKCFFRRNLGLNVGKPGKSCIR